MPKRHLTLNMDAELIDKVKIRAIQEKRTVGEITEQLYREYLKRPKKGKEKDRA